MARRGRGLIVASGEELEVVDRLFRAPTRPEPAPDVVPEVADRPRRWGDVDQGVRGTVPRQRDELMEVRTLFGTHSYGP